jgi:hypothetical protein
MELTAKDIERIPAENIRVRRADFAAVWLAAEQRGHEQGRRGISDWYTAGVAVTCRWLATAIVRPEQGRWYPARSPVIGRTNMALPELIEEEALAAELLDMRRPRPQWLVERPGWSESIMATFNWAWRRTGPPPLPIELPQPRGAGVPQDHPAAP